MEKRKKAVVIINQGLVEEAFVHKDVDLYVIDKDGDSVLNALGYAGFSEEQIDEYERLIKLFGFTEEQVYQVAINSLMDGEMVNASI